MAERRRRHWGWGCEDDPPPGEGAAGLAAHLGFGSAALLLLGFEAVTEPAVRALAIWAQHGGHAGEGAGRAWRDAFMRAPYLRDTLVAMGVLSETFESAITHHHAVGRDHREFYERQRPEPFAAALRAPKAELDPDGRLNPGVLLGT